MTSSSPLSYMPWPAVVLAAALALGGLLSCGGDPAGPAGEQPGQNNQPGDQNPPGDDNPPGEDNPPGDDEPPNEPPGDPTSPLECARMGYPCTLEEVSDSAFERTAAVGDTVADMLNDGSTMGQTVAWIEGQPDFASVISDELALRFRLEGGRPSWVLTPGALTTGFGEGTGSESPPPTPAPDPVVVGDSPEDKRALILSPFAWQFPEVGPDEGSQIYQLLSGVRGYSDNVVYLANTTEFATTVGYPQFTDWNDFDVIHVNTHGRTLCTVDGCTAMIAAGGRKRTKAEVEADWPGAIIETSTTTEGASFVSLGADFFRQHYPDGVEGALVVAAACQTIGVGRTDLADAIRGETSVYVGWDGPVRVVASREVSLALYNLLAAGVTVETAYRALGDMITQVAIHEGVEYHSTLLVTERGAGGDFRIRETVWVDDPSGDGPLEDGDGIQIAGTLGDGKPDAVPWSIRVDGVDAPVEQFTLHVEIDGEDVGAPPLSEGVQVDSVTWRVEGEWLLDRDLQKGETVEIHAWVELPDMGVSEITVNLEAESPPVWMGQSIGVQTFVIASGSATTEASNLVFEKGSSLFPNVERYNVVSGQISWSTEGEIVRFFEGNCTYSSGTLTYDVVPGSGYIEIDHSVDPPRYNAFGTFDGPPITIGTSCSDVDLDTTAQGVWIAVYPEDDKRVANQGTSITGDRTTNTYHWEWNFTLAEAQP